jgi:hypothetical protein
MRVDTPWHLRSQLPPWHFIAGWIDYLLARSCIPLVPLSSLNSNKGILRAYLITAPLIMPVVWLALTIFA